MVRSSGFEGTPMYTRPNVPRVRTPRSAQLGLPALGGDDVIDSGLHQDAHCQQHSDAGSLWKNQPPGLLPHDPWPDAFCWTRMQAESGQPLTNIIRRKEAERAAGNGLFYWGVGNPLGGKIAALVGRIAHPKLLFSMMKSRPKLIDAAPQEVLLWTLTVDLRGVVRPLPDHALVVSRGSSGPRGKLTHYALVCRSPEPLRLRPLGNLNLAEFRNIGSENPCVGNSQVTAVLERQVAHSSTAYQVDMMADLAPPYFVRLAGPIPLLPAERAALDDPSLRGGASLSGWTTWARWLRETALERTTREQLLSPS